MAECILNRCYNYSEHIMDILTAVINDVASKRGYGNECMVPIVQSTLSKKLYFHRLE